MRTHAHELEFLGPWSLVTTRRFWASFTPAALEDDGADALHLRFLSEHDWRPVTAAVRQVDSLESTDVGHQRGSRAEITVTGDGDLDAAVGQVERMLGLDVDATEWPEVGRRDPVIGAAQRALPGYRPCGFHGAFEAAAWAVLSQRTRVPAAAHMRGRLIASVGHHGAFPAPADVIAAVGRGDIDLPGRKNEYLVNVARAALDGLLVGPKLRSLTEDEARRRLLEITGVGPFAADLILVRGANCVDVLPRAEKRLVDEVARLYGPEATLQEVSAGWAPFRSWAAVHLRALREAMLHEMA